MKRTAIALSLISMLGVGAFTVISNASDQGVNPTPITNETNVANTRTGCPGNKGKMELTQEQKTLLQKGYDELTQEEKNTLEEYRNLGKRNLSEEQLKEIHDIQDKAHKYMDEDFKALVKERREQRELRKQNGNYQNGQGQRKGNGQCQQ